jgi:hypothetical protein
MRIHASPVVVVLLNLLGAVIVLALVTPFAPRHAAAAANAVASTRIGRLEELASDEVQGKRKARTGFEWDETRRRDKSRSLFRQSIVGGTVTQGQEFPFFVEGNVRFHRAARHVQSVPFCRPPPHRSHLGFLLASSLTSRTGMRRVTGGARCRLGGRSLRPYVSTKTGCSRQALAFG